MRRSSLLLLTLLLVPQVSLAVYTRLPEDHHYAKAWRIMVTGDRIGPGRNLGQVPETRTPTPLPSDGSPFADVPENHPNYAAIRYVVEQGMMDLSAGRMFRPNDMVSRSDFTGIVAGRVFTPEFIDGCFEEVSLDDSSLLFPDVTRQGEEAKRLCAALVAGVVHGYPDKNFRPGKAINFVEAAKIVSRAYEVSFLSHADSGLEWFKLYVTNLADRAGIPLSIFGFDSSITRAEAAEILYRADAEITNRPSKEYNDLMGVVGRFLLTVLDQAGM